MAHTSNQQSEDLLTQLLRNSNIRLESLNFSNEQRTRGPKAFGTRRNLKGIKNPRPDFLEPAVKEDEIPAPPSSKILSMAVAPDGGKLVSVRDPEGRLKVRIEYDREQMLQLAKSPFAVLPPASMKEMVLNMPEMISTFPVRYESPSAST